MTNGAWVREAALAYAEKRQRASAAASCRDAAESRSWPTPNMPLWEVFIRSRNGLAHKHVGSLHAADADAGAAGRARPLHAARRGAVDLGGAVAARSSRPIRPTRACCSSRRTRRSTAIRPSTTCPKKSDICDLISQRAQHAWSRCEREPQREESATQPSLAPRITSSREGV